MGGPQNVDYFGAKSVSFSLSFDGPESWRPLSNFAL
jgi:hypothetical protein